MKIEQIRVKNFRGISSTELNFQNKCTVFYGINGVGKTTILTAIDLLYSSIINKIVHNRFKQGIQIESTDIQFGKTHCEISCDFYFNDFEAKERFIEFLDNSNFYYCILHKLFLNISNPSFELPK